MLVDHAFRVQLVVVTAFPPELQAWIERFPLPEALPFPQGASPDRAPLRLNREHRILGITTGMGPFRAASSLVSLGHDVRFDVRNAYWLVAGIAGVDPLVGSIGSVSMPTFLVGLGAGIFLDGIGNIPNGRTTPDFSPPVRTASICSCCICDCRATAKDSPALPSKSRSFHPWHLQFTEAHYMHSMCM